MTSGVELTKAYSKIYKLLHAKDMIVQATTIRAATKGGLDAIKHGLNLRITCFF